MMLSLRSTLVADLSERTGKVLAHCMVAALLGI